MSSSFFQRLGSFALDRAGRAIDPAIIWYLRRRVFPAMRLRAAAVESDGDKGLFAKTLSAKGRLRLDGTAGGLAYEKALSTAADADTATSAWREAMFEKGEGDPAGVEMARRRAASIHLATQVGLLATLGRPEGGDIAWRMSRAEDVSTPDRSIFAAPLGLGGVVRGPDYVEGALRRCWLRAPSEFDGGDTYGRLSWPNGEKPVGVMIVGSGVGIEWDLYVRIRSDYDFPRLMTGHGLAVLEMAAPGHGLRVLPGLYGGESFFAGAPVLSAAMLAAQTRETARFIAWVTEALGLPSAIFGYSMSSFAAQLTLTYSSDWPEAARPAAGMLLAHSGDLMGVARGKLANTLGVPDAFTRNGWTDATLEPWRALLAPSKGPVIPPDKIISVLGRYDEVTPFKDGQAIAAGWGLPRENRFEWPQGHMGLALRLALDQRPVALAADILKSEGLRRSS